MLMMVSCYWRTLLAAFHPGAERSGPPSASARSFLGDGGNRRIVFIDFCAFERLFPSFFLSLEKRRWKIGKFSFGYSSARRKLPSSFFAAAAADEWNLPD